MYADIIVDISHEHLDKTFQYAVPDHLLDEIGGGTNKRSIVGWFINILWWNLYLKDNSK